MTHPCPVHPQTPAGVAWEKSTEQAKHYDPETFMAIAIQRPAYISGFTAGEAHSKREMLVEIIVMIDSDPKACDQMIQFQIKLEKLESELDAEEKKGAENG